MQRAQFDVDVFTRFFKQIKMWQDAYLSRFLSHHDPIGASAGSHGIT